MCLSSTCLPLIPFTLHQSAFQRPLLPPQCVCVCVMMEFSQLFNLKVNCKTDLSHSANKEQNKRGRGGKGAKICPLTKIIYVKLGVEILTRDMQSTLKSADENWADYLNKSFHTHTRATCNRNTLHKWQPTFFRNRTERHRRDKSQGWTGMNLCQAQVLDCCPPRGKISAYRRVAWGQIILPYHSRLVQHYSWLTQSCQHLLQQPRRPVKDPPTNLTKGYSFLKVKRTSQLTHKLKSPAGRNKLCL